MRKTVKQLEEKIREIDGALDAAGDRVSDLTAKLKKSENSYTHVVKQQAEYRDMINSLHSVFNAMGFDSPVEVDGYSAPPSLIPRFAIYQNHLLNQSFKSIKPRKVKK